MLKLRKRRRSLSKRPEVLGKGEASSRGLESREEEEGCEDVLVWFSVSVSVSALLFSFAFSLSFPFTLPPHPSPSIKPAYSLPILSRLSLSWTSRCFRSLITSCFVFVSRRVSFSLPRSLARPFFSLHSIPYAFERTFSSLCFTRDTSFLSLPHTPAFLAHANSPALSSPLHFSFVLSCATPSLSLSPSH